jgi:hypothetical protein
VKRQEKIGKMAGRLPPGLAEIIAPSHFCRPPEHDPEIGHPIFGDDHAQTKISALVRFNRAGSKSGRVQGF